MVRHVTGDLRGGVPVAEIIDVLEAASNALVDECRTRVAEQVDRLITRMKESSDG